MKQKLTVSCEGKPCYDIVLTIGFEELAGAALSVSAPDRKICIVTDTNVAPLYAAQSLRWLHQTSLTSNAPPIIS